VEEPKGVESGKKGKRERGKKRIKGEMPVAVLGLTRVAG